MLLLSFSIDLSRSTEVKSLINEITGENSPQKDTLIKEYYDILLKNEKKLYEQFMHNNLPLGNLFLVKSIGDELWYIYSLDNEKYSKKQINNIIIKILTVLSDIISKDNRMFLRERETPWRKDGEVKHKEIFLPNKCFIDLLYDCYDFSRERNEAIFDLIYNNLSYDKNHKKLNKKNTDEKVKKIIPQIAGSLNLGSVEINNDKVKFNYIRFDAIGLDVDLFFRCCGVYSEASLLRVGEKLFKYIASGVNKDEITIEYGEHNSVTRNRKFNYAKVRRKKLKGIKKKYFAFTILVGPYSPPISGQYLHFKNDGCKKARRYLFRKGFLKRNYMNNLYSRWRYGAVTYPINHKKWIHY